MTTLQLSNWDYLVILAYISVLIYLGFRTYHRSAKNNTNDFLLGNRLLSLPAFIATLVTTWYGGILGVGEFAYLYGISSWIVFGLPYYVFSAIFAILLATKIREAGQFTIADMFYQKHNRAVGILGSIFLLFMTSPAPYILMIALLLRLLLGWSFLVCLLFGALASTCYIYFGGFRSVVQTDKYQFILIYTGFIIMFIYLILNYGGYSFLAAELPSTHLRWDGGNSFQYILVWFFLASWTFIDPGFHQRCAAAKTAKVARNGILISIFFWLIFDFLTVSTGLYAVTILKDIDPVLTYPLLADKILPPFLKGLFITGLLAVIMSTVDSFSFLSAITFGRDIIWRLNTKNANKMNTYTKIGLLITTFISIILCVVFPSVIELWYIIGSLFIPPMLLPLLTAYFPKHKIQPNQTLFIMIISFLVSFGSFLFGQLRIEDGNRLYLFGIEPFFPGILLCLLLYILFRYFSYKSPMN
jgi:SSS family solute:Na+ symporter